MIAVHPFLHCLRERSFCVLPRCGQMGGFYRFNLGKSGRAGMGYSIRKSYSRSSSEGAPKSLQQVGPQVSQRCNNGQLWCEFELGRDCKRGCDGLQGGPKGPRNCPKTLSKLICLNTRKILCPKRLLLWKEILQELGYGDMEVFEEISNGTQLVGEVPTCGVFEKKFKSDLTVDHLGDEPF